MYRHNIMHQNYVTNVREELVVRLEEQRFTSTGRGDIAGLMGSSTIEIVGASFTANKDSIFGDVNWEYVQREEEWYNSQSLNVNDIPGGAPAVWKSVADKDGFINSNYGWAIYSKHNIELPDEPGLASPCVEPMTEGGLELNQYNCTLEELRRSPSSRRAIMIYTRPSMWLEYNLNGRSDFMCTNTVQYLIRDGLLHAIVDMRSNDAIFGYRNDRAWQQHVLEKLAADLGVKPGLLHWNAGSLHVYARHFYLVDHYAKTGETHISKKAYDELYPDSPYKSL